MVRSRILFMVLAGCLVASMAVPASAATITFRHGGGSGYVDVVGDAVSINSSPTPDATAPDWEQYHLRASSDPAPANLSDLTADRFFVLYGVKDFLSELPISSSQITTATLTIFGDWGDGDTCSLYRVTTDWQADAAGDNESDTSGSYKDVDTVSTWAGGGAFSSSDFEVASELNFTWPAFGTYRYATPFDVTDMMVDNYDAAAFYGWCLTNKDASDKNIIPMNPAGGVEVSAQIKIEFTDTNSYTLTVDSGTGDGSYSAGDIVAIVADTAPTGSAFAGWIGDDANWIADSLAETTSMVMPPRSTTITATYVSPHALTVNSGSGSGTYIPDEVVEIVADDPAIGLVFDQWVGDTAYLDDPAAATTDVTMPAQDVEVTATYTNDANQYALTINSGSGSGTYGAAVSVAISADPAPTGWRFDEWWGIFTSQVDDIFSASTNFTMTDFDVEITATYTKGEGQIKIREYNLVGDPEADPPVPPETPAAGETHGVYDDSNIKMVDGPPDSNIRGNDLEFNVMTAADLSRGSLVAVKDLFTLLPQTSGGLPLQIHKAKLVLHKTAPSETDDWWGNNGLINDMTVDNAVYVHAARVLTNWLPDEAGTNESDVCGEYAELSTSTTWASGDISESDYAAADIQHVPVGDNDGFPQNFDDSRVPVDVTQAMRDIYTNSTNYGVILVPEHPTRAYDDGYWTAKQFHSSEADTAEMRPMLVIDYDYVPGYTLTVNSGSGGGEYAKDTIVTIIANTPPAGYHFLEWIGDTATIVDVNASTTTLTMPEAATTVTATYEPNPTSYLTVNSGSGETGTYFEGEVVAVSAEADPVGYTFERWVGDTAEMDRPDLPDANVTIPEPDIEITAQFRARNDYTLVVNNGQDMTPGKIRVNDYDEGGIASIAADKPTVGQVFDQWIGDTGGIANVYAMYTTLTMPAADQEVTATYKADAIQGYRMRLREGGGGIYVDTLVDDTYLELDPADGDERGTETNVQIVDGPVTSEDPLSPQRAALVCFTDLFSELSQSSGGDDVTINKAYLTMYRYQGPKDTPFTIARVTTDWVPDAAGSNEEDVSALYSENSSYTTWADMWTNFTDQDYDTATEMQAYIQDGVYNSPQKYDVTKLVQDMYTTGNNYGFALVGEPDFVSPDYLYDEYYGIVLRSSENDLNMRPVLEIDYQYGTLYQLTVNSGSGDGYYAESAVVEIVADAHPSGDPFAAWVGDTGVLTDPNAATTDVTMPASDVEVTATYAPACVPCNGDLDSSGFVGQGDLDIVLDQWGNSGGEITDPRADPSGDDFVGQADLDIVLDDWGKSCEDD